MDSLNKAYIQPLHELRYCLDHFMRCFDYEEDGKKEDLIKKSISSAVGHLQRTYSDSIDDLPPFLKGQFVMVAFKMQIGDLIDSEIMQLYPIEFAKELLNLFTPELEKMTKAVDEYKINKSVEKATESIESTTEIEILSDDQLEMLQVVTDQFLSEDLAKKLQDYLDILHSREVSLLEVKVRDEKVELKDKILIPTVTGVIGVIIGFILQIIFL